MIIKKLIEAKGIVKSFSKVQVLKDVDFDLYAGEVHCLVGENGAGKSTFIKIISGVLQPDSGQIIINEENIRFHNILFAKKMGISTVYQEIDLIPTLSVAKNIFLGKELKTPNGLLDDRKMEEKSKSLLNDLEVEIDPKQLVKKLTVIQQQLVVVCKAIYGKSRILILDEPSAILSQNEVKILFDIIRKLKKNGVGIIYISHRLEEVFEIGDRVTVLKDGKVVKNSNVKELDLKKLINYILGRNLESQYIKETTEIGKPILAVKNLNTKNGELKDINFQLNKSEILGVCGLIGSGISELAKTIVGIVPKSSGDIFFDGEKVNIKSPIDAIELKIGMIPENRREEGIIPCRSVLENISLIFNRETPIFGFINWYSQEKRVKELISKFNIKVFSIQDLVENLSGGNQQKVVLAKWLANKLRIIIFSEPTRGIDIGSKREIYYLLSILVKEGVSIIMFSSELQEIIAISDRILIMSDGHIAEELFARETTQEEILEIISKRKNQK